jgi:hypothetical protein
VLRVASGGKYYILDNRRTDVTGLKGLDKYKILAGLNADSVQIYNVVTPQPPAGFIADETKVAALIDSPASLPKKLAPAPSVAEEPKIVLASAEPDQAPDAGAPAEDDAALMDCSQTATLGDWNPNLPCSAFELPAKSAKAKTAKTKPESSKVTVVAELTPPSATVTATDRPAVAATSAKPAKAQAATKKTKTAAKPATQAKPVQIASAKAAEKPKKKKAKKPADNGGSCVQGATSIADWNPNLPCASEESAARLKLVDVPPAL